MGWNRPGKIRNGTGEFLPRSLFRRMFLSISPDVQYRKRRNHLFAEIAFRSKESLDQVLGKGWDDCRWEFMGDLVSHKKVLFRSEEEVSILPE